MIRVCLFFFCDLDNKDCVYKDKLLEFWGEYVILSCIGFIIIILVFVIRKIKLFNCLVICS